MTTLFPQEGKLATKKIKPASFYWSACTKLEVLMYVCVVRIDVAFVSMITIC